MLPRENTTQMQSQLGSTAQTSTTPAAALQGSKHEGPSVGAKSAAATSSQVQLGSTSKASSSVAPEANSDKQKPKQGMLQLACFCFRPRTRSTEDPYPQESLRDRFAAKHKPDAAGAAAKAGVVANPVCDKVADAISTKAAGSGQAVEVGASEGGALKSKGGAPAGGLARGETAKPDWALKAEQHFEDAAGADASSASDRHSTGEVEEVLDGPLQGAISLAPKHGLAAGQKSFSDDYEGSVGEAVPDAGASKQPTLSQPQQQLPVADMSLSALAQPGVNHCLPPDIS